MFVCNLPASCFFAENTDIMSLIIDKTFKMRWCFRRETCTQF